jgi:uncharacterized protein YndB with AHSA1/START domain/predicted enzyme related to lactoylglutathione lyase
MSTASTHSVQVKRFIKAPPERVFEAWTNPQQLKSWFCPGDVRLLAAEVDLRTGGTYRFTIDAGCGGEETVVHGTYREVSPPTKLVFTWQFADDPEWENVVSVVTVELLAKNGGTEVALRHDGLPTAESAGRHEHGWNGSLDKLLGRSAAVAELNGPGQVTWNELLTSDTAGAKAFYTQLFGWEASSMPGANGVDYTVFKKDGWYVSGMMACPAPGTPPFWLAYVSVENVETSTERVVQLGGKVCKAPFDIPNVGRISIVQDPQGAVLGLFQSLC